MFIRPYAERDYPAIVEILVRSQHGEPHPAEWYVAYSHLVAARRGHVLGFCGWSISVLGEQRVQVGNDICIAPEARGRGLGKQLHEARVKYGRAAGATLYTGLTAPDNVPMIRIFESCGYRPAQTSPAGVVYVGEI